MNSKLNPSSLLNQLKFSGKLLTTSLLLGLIGGVNLSGNAQTNNQSNRDVESEAKNYISSTTRAQQAYRLENTTFANSFQELEINVPTKDPNYIYLIIPQINPSQSVMVTATPQRFGLRSYTGVVFLVKDSQNRFFSFRIVCESLRPSNTPPIMPQLQSNYQETKCPSNSRKI